MATSSSEDKKDKERTDRWDEICEDELESNPRGVAPQSTSNLNYNTNNTNNNQTNLNLTNIPPSPTFGSHWSFHNRNQPDEGRNNNNNNNNNNRRPRHRSSSTDGRTSSSMSSGSLSSPSKEDQKPKPVRNQRKTPGVIYLENTWTFWFDERPPKGMGIEDYESRIKEIGSFSTVQDFWRYWNNIDTSKFAENANLRLFKQGIKPSWEDPANVNGGKWVFYVAKELTSKIWGHLVLGLIGEQLESGDDMNGVVLAIRGKNNNISIWNRMAGDQVRIEATGQQIRKLLSLDDQTRIGYQSHTSTVEFTKQLTQQNEKLQQYPNPVALDRSGNINNVPANLSHRRRRSFGRSSGNVGVINRRRNSFTENGDQQETEEVVEEVDERIVQTGIMKSESCPRIHEDFFEHNVRTNSPSLSPMASPRSSSSSLRTSREDIDDDPNKPNIRKRIGLMKSLGSAPLTPPVKTADWQRHRKSPSDSTHNKSRVTVVLDSPSGFIIETTPSRASSKSPRRGKGIESESAEDVSKADSTQKSELPPLYPRSSKTAAPKKVSKVKKPSGSNLNRMKRTPSDQDVLSDIKVDASDTLDKKSPAVLPQTPATSLHSPPAAILPSETKLATTKLKSFSWIYVVVISLLVLTVLLYLLQQTSLNTFLVRSG